MRMPRARFTVRGMMIAVAVVGCETALACCVYAWATCKSLGGPISGDTPVGVSFSRPEIFEPSGETIVVWGIVNLFLGLIVAVVLLVARTWRTGRMPRFTIRRMMIATAIIGLVLSVPIERRRRFEKRATYHARRVSHANWQFWKYHESMTYKYEFAARYPWLPVAPDPPEPE